MNPKCRAFSAAFLLPLLAGTLLLLGAVPASAIRPRIAIQVPRRQGSATSSAEIVELTLIKPA